SGPGVAPGVVVDDPVGTVDIRSTLIDLCGLAGEDDNGASWMGLIDGSESRDFAVNEWEVDSQRSGMDMDLITVRSGRYRMSVDLKTDTGELYDMQEDPDEMVNLFDDPGAGAVRQEHMDMIRSRAKDQIPRAPRVGWH
ncbi:sulfatase/phosphatase domain-containing protein, partial [Cognatishimia maritima]|uniref:sulfatase/phosphatase domain-containing protein n=1 Tax=Cognatishimia maritima TaxID=870908 RepID=UPI003101A4D6